MEESRVRVRARIARSNCRIRMCRVVGGNGGPIG